MSSVAGETSADRKLRFGGILETPWISKVQRGILDAGRVRGLREGLAGLDYQTVVDVGCGLGEGTVASLKGAKYFGLDNSFSRVLFASQQFPQHRFVVGDALKLPVGDQSFDLGLLIDTSHHLTDAQFVMALGELKRVSRKYIVVSDPIVSPDQSLMSRFFYGLDRGACFRSVEQSQKIFSEVPGLSCQGTFTCRTFPGLYVHHAYILKIKI